MYARPRGGGGRITKKVHNGGHSVFFPYEGLSDDTESKEFPVTENNFEFFHGYNNMFTLQFWTDISIDDIVYRSVDHYYQKMKVFDLTKDATDRFGDPKIKNFSGVAKEILREKGVTRKTVDEWRTTCGVEIIQKALLEKVKQSTAFREHLLSTSDKIICHPFPLDDFFGTGCPIKYVKDWAGSKQKKDEKLMFPIGFPLSTKTAKNVPIVGKGRNMLGAIYIALREQIKNGKLNELVVSLTPVDQLVKIVTRKPVEESTRIPTAKMTRLAPPAALSSVNAIPIGGGAQPNVNTYQQLSNEYSGHYSTGQPPMMYTPEQQKQFQNNRPSIASKLPEVPVAPDLRYFNSNPRLQPSQIPQSRQLQGRPANTVDQLYANYQSQQTQYQQQPQRPNGPSYASLAAQNQDFSMDVDAMGGNSSANTHVTRQHFQPAGANNQSMYQGQYDWQW